MDWFDLWVGRVCFVNFLFALIWCVCLFVVYARMYGLKIGFKVYWFGLLDWYCFAMCRLFILLKCAAWNSLWFCCLFDGLVVSCLFCCYG